MTRSRCGGVGWPGAAVPCRRLTRCQGGPLVHVLEAAHEWAVRMR